MASVTAILGCSRSTARSLLMHFRWNTETLFGAPLSSLRTYGVYLCQEFHLRHCPGCGAGV